MKKLVISFALIGLFALPAQASPLFPASIAKVATPGDDIVQVKKKGAKPYGWSKGRKVGWRGRGMPPGQYKKL